MNGGRSHGGRWSFWRAFSRTEFVEVDCLARHQLSDFVGCPDFVTN